MSTPIENPLVLVGLGATGMQVVTELDETATALGSVVHAMVPSLGERLDRLADQFRAAASGLLTAGSSAAGQARMDIVLMADAEELPDGLLAKAVHALTDVLADDFPVLFPASASPEQRSVWLVVVATTQPLVANETGRRFGSTLRALGEARKTARHPALSRVLLLPKQTTAGQLDASGAKHSLRAAIQTLYLSGSRNQDRFRAVLGHRSDDSWVASLSVATAELPIARVRRYARWRLVHTGLALLQHQAEQPTTDPERTRSLEQQLDPTALLSDFVDGAPAQKIRARAAQISGAAESLPERIDVGLQDGPADIRTRYRVLFEPIAKPWSRRIDPTNDPDHHTLLRLVDQAEHDILGAADRHLHALLDEQLEPQSALRVLPPLEHALKQAIHVLDEDLAHPVASLPSPEPPPPPDDPGLRVVEADIDARPGWRTTTVAGVTLVLLVGAGMTLILTFFFGEAPLPATATSSVVPPVSPEFMVAGLLFGLMVAGLWQLAILWRWRDTAKRSLTKRSHALDVAWQLGGAGQERQQAERLLQVRRRRTAHDLRRRYGAALERLASLRAAIRQTTLQATSELANLRVRVGDTPKQDDLRGLLGSVGPLYMHLVAADDIATRLDSLGTYKDPQRWAGEILTVSWPTVGGLSEDLPCLDEAAVLAAADRQLSHIVSRSLLGAPEQTRTAVQRFLSQAVPALAWGIRPQTPTGDPVRGTGRDQRLVVAPSALRGSVDGALADSPIQLDPLWTTTETPWVSVIALWDGLSVDEVLRSVEEAS